MSTQRIVGIVMVVIGVVLVIIGFNASDSAADQITETFTGRFTDKTMWYLIGGGALALLGAGLAFFKGGSRG
jgi:hypothetical protein